MAEALGWGFDTQPSPTVTAGGTETGGAEVFGNAATRRRLKDAVVRTGNNSMVTPRTGSKAGDGGVQRYERPIEHPAPTLDANVGSKWRVAMGDVRMSNGTVRDVDHPAGTITASLDNGNHQWLLHTNRGQEPDGTRQVIDPSARAAPTLTAKSGGQWVYRNGNQANAARRELEEPAPTVMFAERSNKVDWEAPSGESVRVTVQEAAVLQSFPPDYPWQGTKSAQFRQVGDAVPPRLAAAVIGTCLGLDWQPAVAAHYGQERAA
jgi:DNA (cytosine-5)-methyltransferase 1